jgi:uncharacterized protein VirK/YbjX
LFLESTKFNHINLNRPRLYVKPFRPYISIKWSKEKKVNVIIDTYRFIENIGFNFSQFFLTQRKEIVIAKLIFENKYEGFIKLGYNSGFRNEGEIVITLYCNELGGRISSVVFSMEETKKGEWVCLIGCVQGHRHKHVEETFKLTQKLLHGLRPNTLVIYAAQEWLRNLGCNAIYCIGSSIHSSKRKNAINVPWKKKLNFDYDKFCLELGGRNINKDWFELPLTHIRKEYEEIKSNKRSMYAKRYKMLDILSLQISNSVSYFKLNSEPSEPKESNENCQIKYYENLVNQ